MRMEKEIKEKKGKGKKVSESGRGPAQFTFLATPLTLILSRWCSWPFCVINAHVFVVQNYFTEWSALDFLEYALNKFTLYLFTPA